MRLVRFLVLVATLLAVTVASADEHDAKAQSRAQFLQGVSALEASHPAEALTHFEKAYELFPHFATFYNIGLCHRALGQRAPAANAFQRYLDDSKGAAPPEEASRVRALLAELDGKLGVLTITTTPLKARATIDGKAISTTVPLRIDPGEHVVEATDTGLRPARENVSVQAGERKSIVLELIAEPTPPPPVTPPPPPPPVVHEEPSRFGVAFWSAAGVSVAGLTTFGIAGSMASNAHDAYASAPNDAQAANERSRGITLALVADVGLIVAIVAAGVATYLAVR